MNENANDKVNVTWFTEFLNKKKKRIKNLSHVMNPLEKVIDNKKFELYQKSKVCFFYCFTI